MRTTRRSGRRPSKDQVRAWLVTVIAPMANALVVERQRVGQANWSFRCETQDFEFLWPVAKTVAAPYFPNLEQLLRYRPELGKLASTHDRALDHLRLAARHAYDSLIGDHRFQTLAATWAPAQGTHRYFAEYVVNGIRDLPSYHDAHDIWTQTGRAFLDLRNDPAIRPSFEALDTAGKEFSNAVSLLLKAVAALQVELSDKYKLPPVDPTDAVRA